jgi:DNA-binding response OmpR family regulator
MATPNFSGLLQAALLVEDQETFEALNSSLAAASIKTSRVTALETGADLSAFKKELAFISLDLDFPAKLELIQRLKKDLPWVKIIGLSDRGFFKQAIETLSLGVEYLLVTPFQAGMVPELIEKIV